GQCVSGPFPSCQKGDSYLSSIAFDVAGAWRGLRNRNRIRSGKCLFEAFIQRLVEGLAVLGVGLPAALSRRVATAMIASAPVVLASMRHRHLLPKRSGPLAASRLGPTRAFRVND